MVSTLKCVQLNCQRSYVVGAETNQIIREKVLDMALLQEPYYAYKNIRGLPSYLSLLKPSCESPMVAAVCKRELDPVLLSGYSSRNMMVFSVHFSGIDLFIVNVYCQFGDDIDGYLQWIQSVLDNFRGKKVIIAVDSNAKSPMWFSERRDGRGRKVEDSIFANGLVLLNRENQPKTFSTVNGESNIDLTLVTASLARYVKKWEVMEDWSSSDHRAIFIELGETNNCVVNGDVSGVRWLESRADWEVFYAELYGRVEGFLGKGIESAEEMAVELQNMLREVSSCAMPTVSSNGPPRKNYWWNQNLVRMRSALRRRRKIIRR